MTARPKKAGPAGSPHGAGGIGIGDGGAAGVHDAMVWQAAAPPSGRAAGAIEPAFHRVTQAGGIDLAVHPPGGLPAGMSGGALEGKGGAVGPFEPAAALRETGPRRKPAAGR